MNSYETDSNSQFTLDYDMTGPTPTELTLIGVDYNVPSGEIASVFWTGLNDYVETFNVTLYANTTTIETKEITLESRTSTTLTFTWNTTGYAKGNYTIWAYAWPVQGETDLGDNTLIDGWVLYP